MTLYKQKRLYAWDKIPGEINIESPSANVRAKVLFLLFSVQKYKVALIAST